MAKKLEISFDGISKKIGPVETVKSLFDLEAFFWDRSAGIDPTPLFKDRNVIDCEADLETAAGCEPDHETMPDLEELLDYKRQRRQRENG